VSKPVIGLVGGIGSGKSAVAAALVRRGGLLVSGDAAGHEALRQPDIRAAIVRRWGDELLGSDGEIVRRKLGAIVFADAEQRRALEELVHPWIRRRLEEEIAGARADPQVRFVVLDAAIMLEAGWNDVCDVLVFIDAPEEVRRRRVAARGWSAEDLAARERAQMPLTRKAQRADHVLRNAGALGELERQVDELLHRWGLVAEPAP
jgi:dephospho-CoA kinase